MSDQTAAAERQVLDLGRRWAAAELRGDADALAPLLADGVVCVGPLVFLHVVGALGLFVAMGLEWVLVARLLRVETVEQARDWLGLLGVIRRLSPASLAAILLAGIYMTATVWGGVGWIVVAFVALLLLPPLGMITGFRLPAIQRDLTGESGPLSV